jgi:hypothetical protein
MKNIKKREKDTEDKKTFQSPSNVSIKGMYE